MAPLTLDSPLNQNLSKAIFAILILGGHICIPFMLLCIFISRNPCSKSLLFLHFCFTWVIHSVGFSILFYLGSATGPEPAFVPCIIQAVFVYIAPVLESSFICALSYHICFIIGAVVNSDAGISKLRMMILITGPYIISLVPAFATLIVVMNLPGVVYRSDNYYCAIWFRPLTHINAVIVGIVLCTAVFLQCRVGFLLYRNRLILKQVTVQGFALLHLFIRLSLFLAVNVAGVGMVLVVIVDATNESRIVFQATLPLLAFLTFGTRLSFYRFKQRKGTSAGGERPHARCQPKNAEVIT